MPFNAPFLCRFGRHKPAREPVWNRGFYFARCARCDQDIIRAAGQRWHVPRGAIVVWRKTPPRDYRWGELLGGDEANASLDPRGAAIPARYRWEEFNVSHEADASAPLSGAAARRDAMEGNLPPPPHHKTGRRSTIPDFMGADPPPMPTQADYVPIDKPESATRQEDEQRQGETAAEGDKRPSASIAHLSGYR